MPDAVHTSFKDIVGVVRRSPAMMIALVVVLAVAGYIIYKRSQGTTPNAASAAQTNQSPGYFLIYNEETMPSITQNVTDVDTSHPAPMPNPTPGPKPHPKGPNIPLYPGKSPFPYKYGKPSFAYKEQGQEWTVGFGPDGRVWGVPGKVSNKQWINTPIGEGQKQLLWQD